MYINTYIQACCIHTYIHTYIHTGLLESCTEHKKPRVIKRALRLYTYMHVRIHTYTGHKKTQVTTEDFEYIHKYIHTYVHTYRLVGVMRGAQETEGDEEGFEAVFAINQCLCALSTLAAAFSTCTDTRVMLQVCLIKYVCIYISI